MEISSFTLLGEQLRALREARGFSQPQLAQRVGRDRGRISELERDLLGGRWGRDRLTLFAQVCDALDVVPVLVPRRQVSEVRKMVADPSAPIDLHRPVTSAFDDLFVDLGEEEQGR